MAGRRPCRAPGRRARVAAFAGLACALAALGAGGGSQAATTPTAVGDPLLPDLRTQPHASIFMQARRDLRLSNTISNRGVGPAEIYPETSAGADCDGDGDNANDRLAFQRVFKDSANPASPGYFMRNQDTASISRQVGCMVFHPEHNHWHFEDFSLYILRSEATGLAIGRSMKVSFCVIDTDRPFPTRPGSPRGPFYGRLGCGPTTTEGLSIGWADTYGALLAGQSIDVSGAPAGNYCLISRADPSDRLDEIIETNNGRRTRLFLDTSNNTVTRLSGPCQLP